MTLLNNVACNFLSPLSLHNFGFKSKIISEGINNFMYEVRILLFKMKLEVQKKK